MKKLIVIHSTQSPDSPSQIRYFLRLLISSIYADVITPEGKAMIATPTNEDNIQILLPNVDTGHMKKFNEKIIILSQYGFSSVLTTKIQNNSYTHSS